MVKIGEKANNSGFFAIGEDATSTFKSGLCCEDQKLFYIDGIHKPSVISPFLRIYLQILKSQGQKEKKQIFCIKDFLPKSSQNWTPLTKTISIEVDFSKLEFVKPTDIESTIKENKFNLKDLIDEKE